MIRSIPSRIRAFAAAALAFALTRLIIAIDYIRDRIDEGVEDVLGDFAKTAARLDRAALAHVAKASALDAEADALVSRIDQLELDAEREMDAAYRARRVQARLDALLN